jgi:hypothetical protein
VTTWINISYFIALICVGNVVLLLGLTPVLPDFAVTPGFVREPEHAKVAF